MPRRKRSLPDTSTTDSPYRDRMFCKQCQYNLYGLRESRCPECGRAFRVDDPTTFDAQALGPVAKGARSWGKRIHGAIIVGLSVIALHTAVRIEVYNTLVGGYLPRTDLADKIARGANPKWRARPWDTTAIWLELRGPQDATGNPVTRPLTVAEQNRMRTEIRQAKYNNQFRSFVSTWGLLQYPCLLLLLPASLLFCAKNRTRAARALGMGAALLAVACAALMIYRGYFTSLGW